jgi:hypothetical protein
LKTILTAVRPSEGPAQIAYANAVKFFEESLTHDECKTLWLRDKADITDVQEALLLAKQTYEKRSQQSKARKWIAKISQRVLHYGKIMDILANHHPEYVALVWGAMKFILTVQYQPRKFYKQMLTARIGCRESRRANNRNS